MRERDELVCFAWIWFGLKEVMAWTGERTGEIRTGAGKETLSQMTGDWGAIGHMGSYNFVLVFFTFD